MATKKTSIYSKVNFTTLKNELFSTMKYLASEKVDDTLKDEVDIKFNKKGEPKLTPTSTIEKKVETQMAVVDTCSKILKSIFDREGLSPDIKMAIETLTEKIEQVELYYSERPISELTKRYNENPHILIISKEDRITSRTRVLEKIYKVKPLITELETMKEEVIAKGGYEIPESMMYVQ